MEGGWGRGRGDAKWEMRDGDDDGDDAQPATDDGALPMMNAPKARSRSHSAFSTQMKLENVLQAKRKFYPTSGSGKEDGSSVAGAGVCVGSATSKMKNSQAEANNLRGHRCCVVQCNGYYKNYYNLSSRSR